MLGATVTHPWFVERRGLALGNFGAALASSFGGVSRDAFGDYTAAFLVVMDVMMALLVRRRLASANPAEARS